MKLHNLYTGAFLLLFIIFSTGAQAQSKFVHTSGRDIVTADGKPLLLKGINLGNWLVPEGYMFKFSNTSSPRKIYTLVNELIGPADAAEFWKQYRDSYITEEDIHFIKSCGLNSIRVPFHFMFFASEENPDQVINTGFVLFDRLLKWCEKEDLSVILDMHCAPGGQTGDNIDDSYGFPFLFESEASQNLAIGIWTKIAERYKDRTIIIGYDIINEPVAHYFNADSLNPKLLKFYKQAVPAIRAVDKNHVLFIGGAQWNSNFSIFTESLDPNSVFTFHKYWTPPDQSVIQDYINLSEKLNTPLWLGESGENSDEWINTFREMLEKNKIGWCFWPYKKLDAQSCMAYIKRPAQYDSVIAFAEGPRTSFDDLRKNHKAPALVKQILHDYLENIKFRNCVINHGYLKALGIKEQ